MIKPWNWIYGFIPSNEKSLRRFISKEYLFWISSARNGLYLLLKTLQKEQNKTLTIALPAFTCQVVDEAAKNAGAKVIYYDQAINARLTDIKKVITEKPDILLLSYNFGYLSGNLKEIAKLCKKHNVILIEDCAQALGAKQKETLAGEFGDYALYSFGLSKNIGFAGGIIASNSKLKLEKQKSMPTTKIFSNIAQSIIGPLVVNSLFFPITQKMLHQKVSTKRKYPRINYDYSRFSKNIICNLAKNYSNILKQRQNNYRRITGENTTSACLYYPIVSEHKKQIQQKAKEQGIELDDMKSFKFLPETKGFPKAEFAAKNHLTFALLRSSKEINKIKKAIQ